MRKKLGFAVQFPYLCPMNWKDKNIINWNNNDAKDFLAQYNNQFDPVSHNGYLIRYNKISNRWKVFDAYTWQVLSIDFSDIDSAKKYLNNK